MTVQQLAETLSAIAPLVCAPCADPSDAMGVAALAAGALGAAAGLAAGVAGRVREIAAERARTDALWRDIENSGLFDREQLDRLKEMRPPDWGPEGPPSRRPGYKQSPSDVYAGPPRGDLDYTGSDPDRDRAFD